MISIKQYSFLFPLSIITGIIAAAFYVLAVNAISVEAEIIRINDRLSKEIALIADIDPKNPDRKRLDNSIFNINIYKDDEAKYWNNIDAPPLKSPTTFVKSIKNDSFRIFFSVDLFTPNKRILRTEVFNGLDADHVYKFSPVSSDHIIKFGDQEISLVPVNRHPHNLWYTGFVLALCFFYILFLLFLFNRKLSLKKWSIHLVIGIILRIIIYWVGYFEGWQTMIFFSEINTQSFLNKSIADFWLNILSTGIVLSPIMQTPRFQPKSLYISRAAKILLGFILGSAYNYYCFLAKGFILSDAININVDKAMTLEIGSILILLGLITTHLILFAASVIGIKYVKSFNPKSSLILYSTIGIILSMGPAFHLLSFNPLLLSAYLIAFVLMVDLFLDSRDKNIIWIIWWMVVVSSFTATLIYFLGHTKENLIRKKALKEIYHPHNSKSDMRVYSIDSSLQNSPMPKTISELPYPTLLDHEDIKSYIKSIISQSSSQIDVTDVLIFDNNHDPVISNNDAKYFDISQDIKLSVRLKKKNIFYNPIFGHYMVLYEIPALNNPVGPYQVFIKFKNTKTPTYTLHPEYVLLNNKEVLIPATYRLDPLILDKIQQGYTDFYYQGSSILANKLPSQLTAVSIRKVASLMKPMSLFSYIFTIIGILLFVLTSFNNRVNIFSTPIDLKIVEKTSLRSRIQIVLIALIIFSFISIGFLTAIYFKNILKENNVKNENSIVSILLEEIHSDIQSSTNIESAYIEVKSKLSSVTPLIRSRLMLYDANGKKVDLKDQKDKSQYRMDYVTYNHFISNAPDSAVWNLQNNKNIVPFYYKSVALPFAFLEIKSDQDKFYTQSILDFLSTLLNVYVFLFLIAGAVAIAISNSITKPLANLTDKLRGFKLGRRNEPLEWNRDDEIGTLIKDYNALILKLDESAQIIAKTERDTAWREMAKQVAHEIKNPLTPMKLSIQYLTKALQSNEADNEALIKRVSQTLLEQINNLSEIANEFSNFAKMPKSNNEKVVINEIVEAVHDLFRKREDMDIIMNEPITDLYVFADRGQLVRILNNLVKNAIQAIPEGRRGKISISLFSKDQNAVVKVSDNGVGIPDDMKNKVFTPNFTTKSSGTGLGLAISANIIDGFNGRIYFDTQSDKGTDFFIEIPLMRLEDISQEENRVILE